MTSEQLYRDRLARLLRRQQQLGDTFHRAVKRAGETYETERTRLDKERKALEGLKDEPVVAVRTGPGPRPEVFHRLGAGCGWMPLPGGRAEMFLTEAQDRGLRPCSSCAQQLVA